MPFSVPTNKAIILFDGECNFCNLSVNFIWKRDKNDYFRFLSLQSPNVTELIASYNIPVSYVQDVSTLILLENGNIYSYSTAVLKVLKNLSGIYPILYVFILIPYPLRDFVYKQIAQRRNLLFRKKFCELPPIEKKHIFLT